MALEQEPQASASVATRQDRDSYRRCGYARALENRMDAQSRAHDRGIVSDQKPATALARRCALVLGHTGGCRSREQHAGLAMDGRLRCRRSALLPNLQPGV